MLREPFRKLTPDEVLKQEVEKKQIEKNVQALTELASACLQDEKFQMIRKKLHESIEFMVDYLFSLAFTDPAEYGFVAHGVICKLFVLRKMVRDIEKDAKVRMK